ncbi:glutaredoxin family protein [Thalassobacillus hwangdonensis]|uniref:Glutaredoxin family protein n=2 Tax=Thalassobacillus hwangdonensis TaxID=546108 RepID=A0ABW3L2U7_9BACI
MTHVKRGMFAMKEVILYMRENCCLCDEVKVLLDLLQSDHEFEMIEKDIESDEALLQRFMIEIPVVEIDGELLYYKEIDLISLRERLH